MASHDYTYPRPWAWTDMKPDYHGQLLIHDANDQIVAWIGDMEGTGGADLDNAALIAAAPELLEACRRMEIAFTSGDVAHTTVNGRGWAALREMREAMAKATLDKTEPENVDTSF